MTRTILGIDSLEAFIKKNRLNKKNFGVLCHPSSITSNREHLANLLDRKTNLKSLFGPQHGIYGETQDNMIEWEDTRDQKGRPIHSLYGINRKPTHDSLKGLDFMVVDLFDVGARYYTFIYTLSYMMEVCGDLGIEVIVCDRPNPLGGEHVEGNILDLKYKSFVGLHPLPVCHGMTVGELALYFQQFHAKPAKLHILKMKSWKRSYLYPQTKGEWLLPSPNMPMYETAAVYPGMCLLEATSLSEGRGTTRPFELIGAPFFNWNDIEKEYLRICKELKMKPVHFHRQGFIPTFHKFKGELCFGALQIPPAKFQPLRHMLVLLWIFRKLYGNQWSWKEPPYEYEYEKLPIDILAGGTQMRETIDGGLSLKSLFQAWQEDEKTFRKLRKPYLLYR